MIAARNHYDFEVIFGEKVEQFTKTAGQRDLFHSFFDLFNGESPF